MNERITLLALQASDPKTGWLDRQKFAELIINECLACADRMADSLEKDEAHKEALGASWAALAIARQYGL